MEHSVVLLQKKMTHKTLHRNVTQIDYFIQLKQFCGKI